MIWIGSGDAGRAIIGLAKPVERAAEHALEDALVATAEDARSTSLFVDRTGETRGSIRWEQNGLQGNVTAGGASQWLEYGTRPHRIEPKASGVLAFQINGRTVFARGVNHPGTAERPFMQHARDHGEQTLDYAVAVRLREAFGS